MDQPLIISEDEIHKIKRHSEDTYPEECCGVLIGVEHSQVVEYGLKMENINQESRSTKYDIDPLALLELEDNLEGTGLTVIGIYHSHPDHPAEPSPTDLDYAWPNLSYVIIAVEKGKSAEMTAWKLDRENSVFIEQAITKNED